MNLKKIVKNLIEEIQKDGKLGEQFEKEPIKVVESVVGKDLPDDVVEKIIKGEPVEDFLRYEEGLNVSVDDFLNINLDEIRDFEADDMNVSENVDRFYVNDMPMKDILDLAIEFGYIDLNDPTNKMNAKRVERSNLAYSLRDVTRDREKGQHAVYHHTYGKKPDGRTDWNNIVSTSISWVTKDGYDKSGYKLDPEKYRKMLDDVGLENYGARLQSYYNKLEATRARIIALMTTLQFDATYDYRNSSSWNQNIFGDVAEATDRLSRAMDYYQRIKRACAEIVEDRKELNSEDSIERTNELIKHTFMFDGKNLMDNLTDARDLIKALEAAKLKA
mgnify:CR=1 FL=1